MSQRLGEFDPLFHARRVAFDGTIPRFAEPHILEGRVGPLNGFFLRHATQARHVSNEPDGGQTGHERLVFRHVAHSLPGRHALGGAVSPKNLDAPGGRLDESQNRPKQRTFAGPVRPQQTGRPGQNVRCQSFQNMVLGQTNMQIAQRNNRLGNGLGHDAPHFISQIRQNSPLYSSDSNDSFDVLPRVRRSIRG